SIDESILTYARRVRHRLRRWLRPRVPAGSALASLASYRWTCKCGRRKRSPQCGGRPRREYQCQFIDEPLSVPPNDCAVFLASDTLVTSQSPQCISQVWEINEADIQLTDALYPAAQEAMRRGYYLPNPHLSSLQSSSVSTLATLWAGFLSAAE